MSLSSHPLYPRKAPLISLPHFITVPFLFLFSAASPVLSSLSSVLTPSLSSLPICLPLPFFSLDIDGTWGGEWRGEVAFSFLKSSHLSVWSFIVLSAKSSGVAWIATWLIVMVPIVPGLLWT